MESWEWLGPGAWLASEVVIPSRGLRLLSGVRGTPFHWGQWEGNRIHRPGLLHISVFPVFAEADVVFIRGCCGAHMGSGASGLHCGGLVGQPGAGKGGAGQKEVQPSLSPPRTPPPPRSSSPFLTWWCGPLREHSSSWSRGKHRPGWSAGRHSSPGRAQGPAHTWGQNNARDASSGTCPSSTPRVGLPHSLGSGIQGVKEVPGDVGGIPGDGHHPAAT